MEARILELLQHPEFIVAEDQSLLQKEVSKYPYMQSLKTLHLSAVYHFDKEQYPQELAKTAAYTTDKKILYQFINRKEIAQKKEAEQQKQTALAPKQPQESPVQEHSNNIDFTEASLEDQFTQNKMQEVSNSEISFNAFDSFLPEVKFNTPQKENWETPSKPENNSIEIQEKEKAINFHQAEPFLAEPFLEQAIVEKPEEELKQTAPELIQKTAPEVQQEWKPMSFVQNLPDAQIHLQPQKKPQVTVAVEIPLPPTEAMPSADVQAETAEIQKEIAEETPTVQKEAMQITEPAIVSSTVFSAAPVTENSNIPDFVNTWQNWLKIDRTAVNTPAVPEKILERKTEIIDRFIEENPKISKLKEEVQYVVKEKNDDIWHLMTETLAKLYLEQRLFSKAIKAYKVLQQKHPSRKEEFDLRIKEIKELRLNK